jgi:hypothetical protein
MKFEQIIPEQKLDEVRMAPSNLDQFIRSPEAQGIKVGFEAELIFPGKATSGYDYESDPEPDYSEDRRARDIDDIIDFFDDGEYNSSRDLRELRETLEESYLEWFLEQFDEHWSEVMETAVEEWIEANDWDWDEKIRDHLTEMDLSDEQIDQALAAGSRASSITSSREEANARKNNEAYAHYAEARDAAAEELREYVQGSIESQDRNYENAREEAEEEFRSNGEAMEGDWLLNEGLRYMSDINANYTISWPYYEYSQRAGGEFNEDSAHELAIGLKRSVPDLREENEEYDPIVRVGGGYHSVNRSYVRNPNLWIIESDGSLSADDDDDMPAEIVSPPIPIAQFDNVIKDFWAWAQSEDAYSNESTGFHVGVSLPYDNVDYMKLALFLGDEYVLETFDRLGNTYTESALKKIRRDMKPIDYPNAVNLMRANLIELASKTIRSNRSHGKYTSINPKDGYVEFRSMGGENYFKELPQVINTIKRYAYAMYIASNPHVERKEYAKKLYKLVGRVAPESQDIVQMFVKYSTGEIAKSELFGTAKARQQARQAQKQTGTGGKAYWQVSVPSRSHMNIEVVAGSEAEAISRAKNSESAWANLPDNLFVAKPIRPYQEPAQPAQPAFAQPTGGEFSGQWRIVNSSGDTVHTFGGIGNSQSDANRHALRWLHSSGMIGRNNDEYNVIPIMR